MLDKLDRRILEIVDNSTSIVRSVSKREIEVGVLFPSVSTMDIKRNLPHEINLNIIEGRLNALKKDGHIYFESNRWWLTQKGKEILGKTDPRISYKTTSQSKSVRTVLEEMFSRFEFPVNEFQLKELIKRKGALLEEIEELEERLVRKRLELEELNKTTTRE